MPEQQETHQQPVKGLSTRTYGFLVLSLVALASFFFVYGYLDSIQTPEAAPQAAAVIATEKKMSDVSITGKAAIVVNLTTGTVLYEKNPDAQLPLASITKVPLVLVVAESVPKDTVITIPYDTQWINGGRLSQGERWKLQDVIDYVLITSSNEGAEILASVASDAIRAKYPLAPQSNATLWRMNNLASDLQLKSTYFLNVSGLDESLTQSGAYGSPRDMAKLFSFAYSQYPDVFAGTARNGKLLTSISGVTTNAENTNEISTEIPGLIMGKTGFTDLAGGNLAVVFDAGLAEPVAVIVMGSTREARFSDVAKLVQGARETMQ